MVGVMSFHQTTIGKKVIMAITGLIWVGFLAAHVYGNLKIYIEGPEGFNHYAESLRTLGEPVFAPEHLLWIARIVLIFAILSHVWAAVTLNQRNNEARPSSYVQHTKLRANPAQLTMFWGGIAIFLFVLVHLAHLTTGWLHSDFRGHHDAYHNVVVGFSGGSTAGLVFTIVYMVALVALGFHLFHGTWSLFQTLGLNNKVYTNLWKLLAVALAVLIPLGFATVPLGVVAGILPPA